MSDTLIASALAAIEKAQLATARERERAAEGQALTEASRRAAEKKRCDGIRRWMRARASLFGIVAAIDRELATSRDMALSVIDTETHPADLAGVDVRASILGRPVPAVLQIVVDDDLRVHVRIRYSKRPGRDIRLRTVTRITAADWSKAVVAYLEHASPDPEHPPGRFCGKCGCYLPA